MVAIPYRGQNGTHKDQTWAELTWAWYIKRLNSKPVETKALTSAAIFSLSDLISQLIGQRDLSIKRNILAALWGAVWAGPTAHYWQNLMHKMLPGKDMRSVLMKVVLDQLTYGPLNNIANLMFFSLLVESKGVGHLLTHVKNEYPTIQLNGWKLWPAAAMFNYRYIPLNLRVLFLNLVALGWTTFLNAYATYKPKLT